MIAPFERKHLVALAALAVLALAAGLVCARAGGGEGGAPANRAAALVPAGALAYVNLSTDPDRAQDARLAATAAKLPSLALLRDRVAAAVAPRAFDIERDVRPWLGDELAYAALSPADSIVLAAVADQARAEQLVARVGNLSGAAEYRGLRVLVAGSTAIAFVGGFLAVGTEPAVRAAIDLEQGAGRPLTADDAYRRAVADQPAERSLQAYASAAGVRSVLARRDGLPGVLGALLDRPGLAAAGAALTAEENGLRADIRVAGGASGDSAFAPVLLERIPEDAAAYAGVRGALRLVSVLGRLGAERQAGELLRSLGDEARIDVDRELLAPLSGEIALAVTGGGENGGAPVVTLKAQTAEPRRTAAALARLQEPIARLLAVPGTVPAFRGEPIGGLDAFTLPVTPELAPSYAVTGDSVVISTATAGLEPPRGTLAGAPRFEAVIGEVPDTAESLVFLDLRALLALGEETGLTAIPGFATARDDLSRVLAAGAVIIRDPARPSDTTAELFLEIP